MAKKINTIEKEKRDLITAQALKEIANCRMVKQGKITNWQKNENMYYGVKEAQVDGRANVNLGRMQEHVHTLQAKISKQQLFKFAKRKESQVRRVKRLNALRDIDRKNDMWFLRMLVGSKQLVIYGREIYSYYADSFMGYKPHLTNVDVYEFLIDPEAGGIDLELALHLGDYGVSLMRDELEDGIEKGIYFEAETKELLEGVGNSNEQTQEEINKRNRTYGQNTLANRDFQNNDKFKFWRWCTTFEGQRYYLLLQERAGRSIRVEPLEEMTTPSKMFPKGAWPYWTNAAFPDLTEFWTPSYCDYVREIFMAQDVSINQSLDNAEEINKPMKVVNIGAIEDLAKLKYRRNGIIPTKGQYDANKAVQILAPASIDTPIKVFGLLESIQEKASGVTAGAKGAEQNDSGSKATIYQGNQREAASRFDLLDMSRSFGLTRFGQLWEMGVRDHLTKKVAIDMIGPDGIETEEVSRRDLFKKGDDFSLMIEDTKAEANATLEEQTIQVNFLQGQMNNPVMGKLINPNKAFEIQAKAVGFSEDVIKELLDTSEFGNQELMSECARDIESLLDGDDIKPNAAANNAYKQKIINFMIDHQEDMSTEQFNRITQYVKDIGPIVIKNERRALTQFEIKQMSMGLTPPEAPTNGVGVPATKPVQEPLPNELRI